MTINEPGVAGATTAGPSEDQRAELDAQLAELAAGSARWACTPLQARAQLLTQVHSAIGANDELWAITASRIKGLPRDSPLVGEEWISGPYAALAAVRTLAATVSGLAGGVGPLDGITFGTAPGGRVSIPVLPRGGQEWLLVNGFRAEVWMPPGVDEAEVRAKAGLGELGPGGDGGVGLVLGAGNITSIPALDVLYELVANNRSVLLKLNPVMAEMLPVYTAALAPLIDFGVLRVVDGAGDVGSYLAHHQRVAHVHITGSGATHDVIVYGPGPDGHTRKAAGRPLLDKPITSELGGVSPIIVVPGQWTKNDLRYQAEHVVTQRLHNSGHNCIAAQVVLLSSDWPQRAAFVAEIRAAMGRAHPRPVWYPGGTDRVNSAAAAFPGAERLGDGGCRLLVDVGAADPAALLSTEYFAPVLGIIEVPGSGQAFLDTAVDKANRDLMGTLGANIIAAPSTVKQLGSGFDEAITRLRYGTIAINAWTGVGFLTATCPWGAFSGHTIDDVQSGIGVVHNALLIDSPERTVVHGPFRPFPHSLLHGEFSLSPKPPWFVTARSAATTGRRFSRYAAKPTWGRLSAIFGSAFRA